MKTISRLIILILIIVLNIVGCKNNGIQNDNINSNKNIENSNENKTLSNEEYKSLLETNYEKYLKPIDTQGENIEELLNNNDSNSEYSNDSEGLIDNYKNLLSDSKNNLASFKKSINNLNIDDSNLQNLNNDLIEVCDKIIAEIIEIKDDIDKNNSNLLNKDKESILNYLKDSEDKKLVDEKVFKDILGKIENSLGINLN